MWSEWLNRILKTSERHGKPQNGELAAPTKTAGNGQNVDAALLARAAETARALPVNPNAD